VATPPVRSTLIIDQGTTWQRRWRITDADSGLPRDLTGWTARAQVRAQTMAETTLFEWSPEGLTCDDDGYVTMTVTPTESSAWIWRDGMFDVELVDPTGRVTRIAQGRVRISPEITR